MNARTLAAAIASLALCAGTALGQMDRVTFAPGPQSPGVCMMTSAFGISACSDGGAAIVGGTPISCDGVNLLRANAVGAVNWEIQYRQDPLDDGRSGSVQQTTDGGFILAAVPGFQFPADGYGLGMLKVDPAGAVQWGWTVEAANHDSPVAYKQWDNPRVKQLPDGSYVAIGVDYHDVPGCDGRYDTGVLFRVSAQGVPLFAYNIGQTGQGVASKVAFTDLAVNEQGIFVVGAVRKAGVCDVCLQDIDGLVAWFDFNGNPIRAWALDGPIDPPPTEYCPHPTSSEWGCGLAVDGTTAYFSLTDTMAYNYPGSAHVGRLNVATGVLTWSGKIKSLYPMYHCVERSSTGTILVGGRWDTQQFVRAGLVGLNPATGAVLWGRDYKDPRQPLADALFNLRGIAPLPGEKAWLTNGYTWNSTGEVYFMQVNATGDSACSAVPHAAAKADYLKSKAFDLQVVDRLPIKEWRPKAERVNVAAMDPCRR